MPCAAMHHATHQPLPSSQHQGRGTVDDLHGFERVAIAASSKELEPKSNSMMKVEKCTATLQDSHPKQNDMLANLTPLANALSL